MKAKFLVTGIVLFVCIAGFHSAAGNTRIQEPLQKKAELAAKELTPEKALEKPATESPETKTEETEDSKPEKKWSFKVGGETTNYFISESGAFFGDSCHYCWRRVSVWTER